MKVEEDFRNEMTKRGALRRRASSAIMVRMKSIVIILAFLFALPAAAFSPVVSEPSIPYEAMMIENVDPYKERILLGDLEQFPDMYELVFDKAVDFKIQLKQRNVGTLSPFSLLMVKVNDDGSVSEVFRHQTPIEKWSYVNDMMLGFNLREDEPLMKNIEPGTYRIEVSTPVNEGAYMLILGDETVKVNFFSTLGGIFETQQHFGFTWLRFLLSSYVHYPLGIMVVLVGILFTWRKRATLARRDI